MNLPGEGRWPPCIEECCLRTAKIQPLLRKIQSINRKIAELKT